MTAWTSRSRSCPTRSSTDTAPAITTPRSLPAPLPRGVDRDPATRAGSGGTMLVAGFLTPDGAADFGWFAYAPLSSSLYSPGVGADLWVFGLVLSGTGTILGAVNLVTTILTLRAPGMTMFRMPIFCWNMLVTSILVLVAFPVFAAAGLALAADRHLGAHVFDASNGGAILWQHLFWFFGHPEVYIIALPFFGVVTEVIPVFSRKPLFGYKGLVF